MLYDSFMIPMFQGDIGSITKAKLAKHENSRTFYVVLMRLINMALDYRYSLDKLPDTVDERLFKQSELFYGSAVCFTLGGIPIALSGMQDGKVLDIFGNPRSAYVFSRNGKLNENVQLNYKYDTELLRKYDLGSFTENISDISKQIDNGVIVYENKTRTPFIWTVIYFAERIADTLRTLDLDRRWLKRPFIPRCEESEAKSFDESLKKFMSNEDFTVSLHAHNIDKTDIFTVDIGADLITHVTQLAEWYENQFKILCGIDANGQIDKKGENLITGELTIDNMITEANTNTVIEEMNSQLEVFNKLAGTSIEAVMTKTKQGIEESEEQANIFDPKNENTNQKSDEGGAEND